jgi:hypothetical protein
MVAKPNPTRPVPLEDERVQQQLAQLFGASLFGPWPELAQNQGKPPRRRRSSVWIYRLLVTVALIAAVWGGRRIFAPGLQRQTDERRANYAEELQSFINNGEFERAAQFVYLVRGSPEVPAERTAASPVDAKDPYLELVVRAEAVLYRYFDAEPERLTRLRSLLGVIGQNSRPRQIAGYTIQSRAERAGSLPELQRLHDDLPNSYEVEYLLATALDAHNDVDGAQAAFVRSARLAPAWLGHRFEQAWFDLRHEHRSEAQKIAREMERIDPDSPWSHLALATCEIPKSSDVPSVRGDAAVPVATPVQAYFEALQQCIAAGRRGDEAEGKARLFAALGAIHHQRPFLFDTFDWLVEQKQFGLARALAESPEWPRDDKLAQARIERLAGATSALPKADASAPANAEAELPETPKLGKTQPEAGIGGGPHSEVSGRRARPSPAATKRKVSPRAKK